MNSRCVIALAALMIVPAWLSAGYTQPQPVVITINPNVSGIASGDMVSARESLNAFEFIGCGIRAFDDGVGGAFYTGFCQAGLTEDQTYTCFTDNKALLDGIQSIADSSFITFAWDDDGAGNLTCNYIGSSTQSFYLPKQKGNL